MRVSGPVGAQQSATGPFSLTTVSTATDIPAGPLDELLVLAVVLVPVLRSAEKRSELSQSVTAAWRGE